MILGAVSAMNPMSDDAVFEYMDKNKLTII
jgi:hypothetical protein